MSVMTTKEELIAFYEVRFTKTRSIGLKQRNHISVLARKRCGVARDLLSRLLLILMSYRRFQRERGSRLNLDMFGMR